MQGLLKCGFLSSFISQKKRGIDKPFEIWIMFAGTLDENGSLNKIIRLVTSYSPIAQLVERAAVNR